MKVELLEFKRCCFCLPLRYGLLISGYLKLLVSVLLLVALTVQIATELTSGVVHVPRLSMCVTIGLIILVIMCEIALTIVLLVGGHKKNAKLLSVYNYYSIGVLVLCVLALIVFIAHIIYLAIPEVGFLQALYFIKIYLAFALVNIGFQLYMILVNKSEITKLKKNSQFRFTNNANEAQCAMDVGYNQINDTYIKNSEPVDQNGADDENEENYQTESKLREITLV